MRGTSARLASSGNQKTKLKGRCPMVWIQYVVLYLIGIVAAILSPRQDVEYILTLVQPIALTALIASLLVPFAAFSKSEKWQRWCVQFSIVPLFGMYTVLAFDRGSVIGIVMLTGASAVHLGYWQSGLHSRAYRLKMYQLGFAQKTPETCRLLARLNGTGNSHLTDAIVKSILERTGVPIEALATAKGIFNKNASAAQTELEEFNQDSLK